MTDKRINLQYGLWKSPITPASLSQGLSLTDTAWDDDGTLVWRESRSDHNVLVVQPNDGNTYRDLNSDFNIRAHVGYGGGDFTVGQGNVYFIDSESGRIYRQPTHSGTAKAITPSFGSAASPVLSPDGKHLLFVHSYEWQDAIGLVDSNGEDWPTRLVCGDDFYMQPCWHPSGKFIAWISWNHPQMPWDGTILYLGSLLKEGKSYSLGEAIQIAGDETTSIFQPQFSPDGQYLAYISDQDGWWHLYLHDLDKGEVTVCTQGDAEHGAPAWIQGIRTYDFSPDGESITYLKSKGGFIELWAFDIKSNTNHMINLDAKYSWLNQVAVNPDGTKVALIASGSTVPPRVLAVDSSGRERILRRSYPENLPTSTYSKSQSISWEGPDGETAYGLYYPPQNESYASTGKPPLMVLVHGGPTGQRGASFDVQAQFFCSRGWSVLQVNYRGSAGYGREYRDKLKGNWGIFDVEDSISGVKFLDKDGQIDMTKVVIMGGSAGGFTVLKALEDYPGFFKAGVCMYGVANQFTLAADTHKFEERYLDSLLGPLPEAAAIYKERSPLFFADRIKDPVAVFQGEDDKVVPMNQSEEIVTALRQNGVPHEYHIYPGEGHGFRKKETIEKFYNSVDRFLRQYVIFS
jgi:dipeptidyl aminopeptidase/acylaminoacyl peptidase